MNILKYFAKNGIDTVDQSFYDKINEWAGWYRADLPSFYNYRVYRGRSGASVRCRRKSLKMAKTVCEDMANLLLNERVRYVFVQDADYDFVMQVLRANRFPVLGNRYQEWKSALGTVAYVLYLDGIEVDAEGNAIGAGEIKIDYVTAQDIYPITWENDRITECAFTFHKTYKRKHYTHIQLHMLKGGQYVIENHVVRDSSKDYGQEVDPADWEDIPMFASMQPLIETGSDRPQFVIDKLNIANNADLDGSNPMGIALFANALDVIAKIDLEYDSFANEFLLGRKRIFVAPELLTNVNGNPAFDPDDSVFYELPEDYFKDTHEAMREVDMKLRVSEHRDAINDDLNHLSTKCGFGQNRYRYDTSNANALKTATEVISENSELYRNLTKHELVLEGVLQDLCTGILRLGVAMGVPGLDPDDIVRVEFDDSIIQDKVSEREQDRADVAMGAMGLAEYRAKHYGESEEIAATRIPEQTGIMA